MKNITLRLQVYLARCGIGSRRACEAIIEQGRITVNGRQVTRPGTKVGSEDIVELDGRAAVPERENIYIALNKPPGFLCANLPDGNKPLALDLIHVPDRIRLFHVGRLDFLSSGLILYTNDGDFSYRISHPSFGVEKQYTVEIRGTRDMSVLDGYVSGLTISGLLYKAKRIESLGSRRVLISLVEGKNREIRRVFQYLHLPIRNIRRTKIGVVGIEGIAPGRYRHLTKKELSWFRKLSRNNDSRSIPIQPNRDK